MVDRVCVFSMFRVVELINYQTDNLPGVCLLIFPFFISKVPCANRWVHIYSNRISGGDLGDA